MYNIQYKASASTHISNERIGPVRKTTGEKSSRFELLNLTVVKNGRASYPSIILTCLAEENVTRPTKGGPLGGLNGFREFDDLAEPLLNEDPWELIGL